MGLEEYSGFEDYRQKIFEAIGYEPMPLQWKVHNSMARNKLVSGGDRGGKSRCGSAEGTLYIVAPQSKLVWLVGSEYVKTKAEFEYCWNDAVKLGLLAEGGLTKTPPWEFKTKNGCTAVTKAANEPKDLIGEAPDFILGCEGALLLFEAYRRFRGRAAEKRAPILMSGSLEGSMGWWPEYFTRWQTINSEEGQSFVLPTWDNERVFPKGNKKITLIDGRTIENVNDELYQIWIEEDPSRFLERYGAVPCKPSGLIINEFSNSVHVGDYQYDPDVPVEIAVDPGTGIPGAYAVLAIQCKEGGIYIIAEKYIQGKITEDIILSCQKDWTWFDKIKGGTIDIAAKQRHGTEGSIDVWREKTGMTLGMKYIKIEDGIDRLKTFFKIHPETGHTGVHINYSCTGIISECGGCKSPAHGGGPWLRDKNTGLASKDNCHSLKALAYYVISRFGYSMSMARREPKVTYYY